MGRLCRDSRGVRSSDGSARRGAPDHRDYSVRILLLVLLSKPPGAGADVRCDFILADALVADGAGGNRAREHPSPNACAAHGRDGSGRPGGPNATASAAAYGRRGDGGVLGVKLERVVALRDVGRPGRANPDATARGRGGIERAIYYRRVLPARRSNLPAVFVVRLHPRVPARAVVFRPVGNRRAPHGLTAAVPQPVLCHLRCRRDRLRRPRLVTISFDAAATDPAVPVCRRLRAPLVDRGDPRSPPANAVTPATGGIGGAGAGRARSGRAGLGPVLGHGAVGLRLCAPTGNRSRHV